MKMTPVKILWLAVVCFTVVVHASGSTPEFMRQQNKGSKPKKSKEERAKLHTEMEEMHDWWSVSSNTP
jgi:hypothetical protein